MGITAILSFILGGGKGTKISLFLLVAALCVVSTFVGMKLIEIHQLNGKISELTKKNTSLIVDNSILVQNNKVLKENQQVLSQANQTNYETAKKLDEERSQAKTAIASLAAVNQRDHETINLINSKISDMAKDPHNDGAVSPILRETIRRVQERSVK